MRRAKKGWCCSKAWQFLLMLMRGQLIGSHTVQSREREPQSDWAEILFITDQGYFNCFKYETNGLVPVSVHFWFSKSLGLGLVHLLFFQEVSLSISSQNIGQWDDPFLPSKSTLLAQVIMSLEQLCPSLFKERLTTYKLAYHISRKIMICNSQVEDENVKRH